MLLSLYPSESCCIFQCAVKHEIVYYSRNTMQCSFFSQPVTDDKGLQKMSKHLQDNWTVFEGEKFGLKAQEMQFLQLKHKIKEQNCNSHRFSWLLKSFNTHHCFITPYGMEVSVDHEVHSGYCFHKMM